MIELRPWTSADADEVEVLLDGAFGADRRTRTAYRIREGAPLAAELSFAAFESGALAGSIQCWPVALTVDEAAPLPLIMVGPVAVSLERANRGIGKAMLSLVAAELDARSRPAMLIGDAEYYAPFGFVSGPAARWTLPGPAESHRILLRAAGRSFPEIGSLGPLRGARPSPN